ncbi:unnamed protein product [Trifolium pratense]|uniref:Uncharacterized protein n=1 Tax=Trifolium pratense TaxID=57577 RepID=A0ACB0M3T3_TRIPR|nr:unnamed protein product [Trifolium pratense]
MYWLHKCMRFQPDAIQVIILLYRDHTQKTRMKKPYCSCESLKTVYGNTAWSIEPYSDSYPIMHNIDPTLLCDHR